MFSIGLAKVAGGAGRWAALCMAVALAACATMGDAPRTLTVSEAQLQEIVEKNLNVDHRLLAVFDVNIGKPKVTLQPDMNRVLTGLDVSVKNPISGGTLKGSMAVSGRLNWDAKAMAVVLADPRAESFAIEGLPSQYSSQVNQLGGLLAEQFLKDFTVYKLRGEELRYRGRAFEPKDFRVKSGGIEIVLGPRG